MAKREDREIRKELSGPEAMPYIGRARLLLGMLKEHMRFANLSQLQWVKDYKDGIRIIVTSVFGQDKVSISVPVYKYAEESDREKSKRKINPYLWIGARIMYERTVNVPYAQFGLVVSEPGENGILTAVNNQWGYNFFGLSTTQPLDALSVDAQTAFLSAEFEWVDPARFCFRAKEQLTYPNWGAINFTKNLMRHYDVYDVASADTSTRILPPYDPLGTPEALAARVFPVDYPEEWKNFLWDQVVVIDPDEGNSEPTSDRPQDRQVLDILSAATGIGQSDMVIPGTYVVKVVSNGPDCNWSESTPEWRDTFTSYIDPLPIEIEVRIGKAPDTVTKRYEIEIPRASEVYRNLWPFGEFNQVGVGCPGVFSDVNHHYNCWWQDALLIDVENNTVELATNYIPDYFNDNSWGTDPKQDCLQPEVRIYCTLYFPFYGYSYPSTPEAIAQQVWNILEANPWYSPTVTLAEITAAALATIVDEKLYRYDANAKTFTLVPDAVTDPNPTNPGYYPWDNYYRVYELQHGRSYGRVIMGLAYGFDGFEKTGDPDFDYCSPLSD